MREISGYSEEVARTRLCVLVGVVLLAGLLSLPRPAAAEQPFGFRLVTNNDIFGNGRENDDFFTFGLRMELSYGRIGLRVSESAFTDREDGFRYDETYATIGTLVPRSWTGRWNLWVEAGVAELGEGWLGQEVQNDVHDWIGDDPVLLDYLEGFEEDYLHLQAEIGRQFEVTPTFSIGPQLGAGVTIDYRTNVVAGLRTIWRPSPRFNVDVTVGGRFAETDLPELEPHLKRESLAALVEIDLPWGFVVEWSNSRYGTNRTHVSFGVSFGKGKKLRRYGHWVPGASTP